MNSCQVSRSPMPPCRPVFRASVGLLLLFALASVVTSSVVAAERASAPRFEDYPAGEHLLRRNAPLAVRGADLEFRTRLREAAGNRPNFAGHYILTVWGCGAGCVMGAAIDARTGRVARLPGTICCWPQNVEDPLEFRLDSALISLSGLRNEKEGDQGVHYYRIDGLRFIHVRDVPAGNP
jgi:hypothetical protein